MFCHCEAIALARPRQPLTLRPSTSSRLAKYANTAHWAQGEQSGVAGASNSTVDRLAQLNREYESRFGYTFIVCATGKSADEMLAILECRLANSPESELQIAAAEQLKITQLRLQKLADQPLT